MTRHQQNTLHDDQHCSARGMSLVEAMVSLLLLSLIMVAFLGILDSTARVAKVQGNIADSTENLRFSMAALVRIVRMAGTGGLPIVVPDGASFFPLAMEVIDHTDGAAPEDYGGKTRLAGTDVLLIRGVIVSDLVEFKGEDALDFAAKTLRIPNEKQTGTPTGDGVGQGDQLAEIEEQAERPIVLAMNTFLNINTGVCGTRHYGGYRVIETADDANAIGDEGAADAENFKWTIIQIELDGDSKVLNENHSFDQPKPETVYASGFIDEMWFFIAENSMGEPSLYRFDGTGNAEELVPNIANLQIALGCDVNCDGVLSAAEWYYSAAETGGPTIQELNTLREVRISLVARSMAPERSWSDDSVMPENANQLSGDDLKFRYRVMTVRTGLRSHPLVEDV